MIFEEGKNQIAMQFPPASERQHELTMNLLQACQASPADTNETASALLNVAVTIMAYRTAHHLFPSQVSAACMDAMADSARIIVDGLNAAELVNGMDPIAPPVTSPFNPDFGTPHFFDAVQGFLDEFTKARDGALARAQERGEKHDMSCDDEKRPEPHWLVKAHEIALAQALGFSLCSSGAPRSSIRYGTMGAVFAAYDQAQRDRVLIETAQKESEHATKQ